MSVPVPLTVRVSSIYETRVITNEINSLTFRWTDPGGYAACTVSLSRPLGVAYKDIDYYSTLTVMDAQNGSVVWEGRLEDPSRQAGSGGEVWELSAVGGQAHTRDVNLARIYIDTALNVFNRVANLAPNGQDSVTEDPGGSTSDAIVMSFPQGSAVVTGTNVVMRNDLLRDTGQTVASLRYSWDAGTTDSGWQLQAVLATDTAGAVGAFHPLSTAGSPSPVQIWAPTHFPADRWRSEFKLRRTGGATTVGNDNLWVAVRDVVVIASRTTRQGAQITGFYNHWVLAHEVIEDLLATLPMFDKGRANVSTGATTQIDQLSYADGTTAEQILTDLMGFEAGYTWRVWERDPTSGRYVFEWQPVPVSVRYEADIVDGYDSSASSEGVYNSVTVRWKDSKGATRTTIVNASSPTLDAATLTRRGLIDLDAEVGSAAMATRAGQQWLADRTSPANAGRLTITRPIQDFESGRMVKPWEIRPGLIRVRGVLPRTDALNSTTRDGVTIFRIVGCEYDASSASATLELDSYPPSLSQTIAQLQQQAQSPGRRKLPYVKPGRR